MKIAGCWSTSRDVQPRGRRWRRARRRGRRARSGRRRGSGPRQLAPGRLATDPGDAAFTGSWSSRPAERVVDRAPTARASPPDVDVGERAGGDHAVEALEPRLGVPRQDARCALRRRGAPGETTMSVAASLSKRPTIWLLAVFDRPSVATSAATPTTVPSTVSATRAGRASRPAIASPTRSRELIARAGRDGASRGDARSRGSRAHVSSVSDCRRRSARPARVRGDVLLVGDQEHRQPVGAELLEEREHRRGVGGVEVARRLVAQQQAAVGPCSARAIATRCCSPPESCSAGSRARCRMPDALERRQRALRAALARARRGRPRRA